MRIRSSAGRAVAIVVLAVAGCHSLLTDKTFAEAPPLALPASLSLAEIKMTGDEFLVITNNGAQAIPDLSAYWLYNYNKTNPQTAGATTTTQQLPAAPLSAGASLLLSDGGVSCGAQATAKLGIGLGDSAGALQLLGSTTAGLILPTPLDQVSWSSGASGDIQNVPSSTKDKQAAYYRTQNGIGYSWQLADVATDAATGYANICQLNVVASAGPVQAIAPSDNQLLPPGQAPATIVSLAGGSPDGTGPYLPTADVGLSAPQITELLPNPAGTGTDATDEFIELYNSNAVAFDLTGFTLETGLTTKHKYVFPDDTILPAQGFTAFYSADTGLSLSNTSGAADLLDPFGNPISQTDQYGSAKDGATWALAKGAWYWTTAPTPGAANVIVQATSTKTSAKKTAVKGAATTKGAPQSGSSTANTSAGDTSSSAPIHPYLLAIIVILAVGYGAYEYRHDLANKFNQFRADRTARRKARPQPARW